MAFINRGYGIAPPSIGVATLDGLNAMGYPYDFFVVKGSSNPADTLTSKPIDLNYPASDSIYFSFYCQPKGLGNNPESPDVLILEFKSPNSSSLWTQVWSSPGFPLADSAWKRVMIPITEDSLLKKGFQFRFRNYATINGNFDQWNIDNIYLNRLRTITDTVISDISWVYNGRSLLKDYTSLPWRHYNSGELVASVANLIRNNDSLLRNISYSYEIENITTASTLGVFNGSSNIFPFSLNKRYTDCDINIGCISSAPISVGDFPVSLSAPTTLQIKHYFSSGMFGDVSPENDTIVVVNDFQNYFAYDDGTAESAVGLNVLNARMALQFTTKVEDTISCVDIFFNPHETNAELYAFVLHVWSDVGGLPGEPIYTSSSARMPQYARSGHNIFTRYCLDYPLYLEAGTYYIGFTQKTENSLNVGLDKNTNTQNRIFYNTGGAWQTSAIKGSLMMHPIMGYIEPKSMPLYLQQREVQVVYPNPARDKLYLSTVTDNVSYRIIDMFGREIVQGIYTSNEYIDVSGLSVGVYFITTPISASKFVKVN